MDFGSLPPIWNYWYEQKQGLPNFATLDFHGTHWIGPWNLFLMLLTSAISIIIQWLQMTKTLLASIQWSIPKKRFNLDRIVGTRNIHPIPHINHNIILKNRGNIVWDLYPRFEDNKIHGDVEH
jgi:hypothetical protein